VLDSYSHRPLDMAARISLSAEDISADDIGRSEAELPKLMGEPGMAYLQRHWVPWWRLSWYFGQAMSDGTMETPAHRQG
jgi:hypothetical protein